MSRSNRGDRGALVALAIVVIAVVIVALFGGAGEPFNEVVGQPVSDYIKENQNADVAQLVASSYNPWLDSYAQWLMAALSFVGAGVSVLAVLLLRKTLHETQTATQAAQTSASASVLSARLQQESFERLECPYLFVRIMSVHHPEHDIYYPSSNPFGNLTDPNYYVSYTFDNFGRTPASIVSVSVSLTADPVPSLRLPMAINDEQYEAVSPGKSMERTLTATIENPVQDFKGADAKMLLLHGFVQYEDPMGALHTYSFLLRGKEGGHRFQVHGGRQYNWRKVAYPKDREKPDYGVEKPS